jgi:hypothetical protein
MANGQHKLLGYWLRERVRDALIWPVNLVRDFPVRSGRVLVTLWIGVRGTVSFPGELLNAGRDNWVTRWATRLPSRMIHWLHRLLNQLFDLAGGPELAQFLMHLITFTTPLTPEETALIVSVMGPDRMRYRQVRVAEGGLLDLIFKYNGNLAYTTWQTIHFPRNAGQQKTGHTRADLNTLIHELTHVYQYEQVGSRYLGEAIYMLIKTKRHCYDYGLIQGLQEARVAGKRYRDFNREQQAQIVQDYFALRQRGRNVAVYEPFVAEMRAGQL